MTTPGRTAVLMLIRELNEHKKTALAVVRNALFKAPPTRLPSFESRERTGCF
jgi:hypothetical protein